ncbi:Uncharacterised protein [Vibrio cholerae]|uniref:Uncharacterized protein n=1 Tax=Vibrio cholerae TaxID=666 RepID=A0A655ZIC9_VIBCL|nr:Uncharacterised protein [Vibrio cholerae]
MRSRSAARLSEPSGCKMACPKWAAIAFNPSVSGSTTSRASTSASTRSIPN